MFYSSQKMRDLGLFVHPRLARTNRGQKGGKEAAGSEKEVIFILFNTAYILFDKVNILFYTSL